MRGDGAVAGLMMGEVETPPWNCTVAIATG